MNIYFKLIFIILVLLCISYVAINILTTVWLRATNKLHKLPKDKPVIYLTFDDGIDSKYTPQVLSLLKQYDIKATFFLVTNTIEKNKTILDTMKKDGHLIGIHSYSHKNQIIQNPFTLAQDYKQSIEIFEKFGLTPLYFRPTWGHISLLGLYICKMYHLKIILWNVIVQDWQNKNTPKYICKKLDDKVCGNSVICVHDGRGDEGAPQQTLQALSIMIPKWLKEGYCFETIDELY